MKTRLQRFLADCGVASRRQCEEMILAGRVSVNGQVRTEMPVLIDPEKDMVAVDEEKVGAASATLHEQKKVYLLLNKPKGILVTNRDPSQRKTVGELMAGVKERVFPVGRLDMDSRGALLMTNDGELANRLTHARYGIEKTYIVEVDGRLGHEDLEKMKRGMWLGPHRGAGGPPARGRPRAVHANGPSPHGVDTAGSAGPPSVAARGRKTEPFRVKLVGRERGRTILEVHVAEAKNSEIRRVMARLGHPVRDLNRVAIGEGGGRLTLKGLEPGQFRPLSESEIRWLYQASSPEFHARKQSATQVWYEQKEMTKERKRLQQTAAAEAAASTAKAARAAKDPRGVPKPDHRPSSTKEERLRPERRGRKPFVPPTGRNAGKPLGGNYIGKQRLERDRPLQEPPAHEDAETIRAEIRATHPLGDAAQSDE